MNSQQKKPVVPILVALLVVAVGAIVYLVVSKGAPVQKEVTKVQVPDILYLEKAEAESELEKVGLKLGKTTEEDFIFGGFVLETSPEAGTSVDEGTAVDVVISVGKDVNELVEVPDLTGKTPEEAEDALMALWIIPQPGDPSYSDDVEAGKICAQSVATGTKMSMLETVTYSVSLGKEQVTVPNVAGKPVDEARDALKKAGLSCDTVTSYSDEVAKDVVISQSIAKDTQVNKGTTVTIEVSLGQKPAVKVVVPNIISYSLDEAIRALESAGLKYTYVGDEDGTVISIRPVANTQVDQGSTVSFELKRPEPTKPANSNPEPSENTDVQDDSKSDDNNNDGDNGNDNDGDGFEEYFGKEECMQIATDAMGAGGQATGPANDLESSDLITGGGTKYYLVEYNLGEAHYCVKVDAIDGIVLEIVETIDGIENTYDADHNLLISQEIE